MEIIRRKIKNADGSLRVINCGLCRKSIDTERKVKHKNNSYYHLHCYYRWLDNLIKRYKLDLNKLKRYKKYMVLEKL